MTIPIIFIDANDQVSEGIFKSLEIPQFIEVQRPENFEYIEVQGVRKRIVEQCVAIRYTKIGQINSGQVLYKEVKRTIVSEHSSDMVQ